MAHKGKKNSEARQARMGKILTTTISFRMPIF